MDIIINIYIYIYYIYIYICTVCVSLYQVISIYIYIPLDSLHHWHLRGQVPTTLPMQTQSHTVLVQHSQHLKVVSPIQAARTAIQNWVLATAQQKQEQWKSQGSFRVTVSMETQALLSCTSNRRHGTVAGHFLIPWNYERKESLAWSAKAIQWMNMLKGEQFLPDSWNVSTFLKWACLKIVYPQMSSCIKMFSTKIVRHYIHVHPIFRHTQLPDSDPVSQIPLLQEHGCGPRLQCRPALFLIERFCLARSDRSSKKNSCNMRQLESLYWGFLQMWDPLSRHGCFNAKSLSHGHELDDLGYLSMTIHDFSNIHGKKAAAWNRSHFCWPVPLCWVLTIVSHGRLLFALYIYIHIVVTCYN